MSSNATSFVPGFRNVLSALAVIIAAVHGTTVAAQDDTRATADAPAATSPPPAPPAPAADPPPPKPRERVNLLVTVPRGEVNQAQAVECEERADASAISGEIVVCRQIADDGSNSFSGSRAEAQKRYAEETAFKNAPRAPDFILDCRDQGNPFGCVSVGKVPPPAYLIDFEALPTAPAGSDADRIARGLPPLNKDAELTEEEEKARREAMGIKTTLPARAKKKGN